MSIGFCSVLFTLSAVQHFIIVMSGNKEKISFPTVVPTKSNSDVILCLQLLCKTLYCTRHLSKRDSIEHLCINPILQIG